MKQTTQTITRSDDAVIAGVIGGLAEYYHVEPMLLRLAAVFLAVATGFVPAVVTYGAAVFFMPASRHEGSSELAAGSSRAAD